MNPLKLFSTLILGLLIFAAPACTKQNDLEEDFSNDPLSLENVQKWEKYKKFERMALKDYKKSYELLFFIDSNGKVTNLDGRIDLLGDLKEGFSVPGISRSFSCDCSYSNFIVDDSAPSYSTFMVGTYVDDSTTYVNVILSGTIKNNLSKWGYWAISGRSYKFNNVVRIGDTEEGWGSCTNVYFEKLRDEAFDPSLIPDGQEGYLYMKEVQ